MENNKFELSGEVNIKFPDFRKAKMFSEQTAETTKCQFVWEDGLIIEFNVCAGKVSVKTNRSIKKNDDGSFTIE